MEPYQCGIGAVVAVECRPLTKSGLIPSCCNNTANVENCLKNGDLNRQTILTSVALDHGTECMIGVREMPLAQVRLTAQLHATSRPGVLHSQSRHFAAMQHSAAGKKPAAGLYLDCVQKMVCNRINYARRMASMPRTSRNAERTFRAGSGSFAFGFEES